VPAAIFCSTACFNGEAQCFKLALRAKSHTGQGLDSKLALRVKSHTREGDEEAWLDRSRHLGGTRG